MDTLMQEFTSFEVYLLHWILWMLKIIIEVNCIKLIDNFFSDCGIRRRGNTNKSKDKQVNTLHKIKTQKYKTLSS